MKNIGKLFGRLFVISLLAFRYFSTIVSLFGAGAAPFFYGSGSSFEQTVSAAQAPAPTKMCRLRELRLWLCIPAFNHLRSAYNHPKPISTMKNTNLSKNPMFKN